VRVGKWKPAVGLCCDKLISFPQLHLAPPARVCAAWWLQQHSWGLKLCRNGGVHVSCPAYRS